MNKVERKPLVQNEEQRKALVNSLFNHIEQESRDGLANYRSFYPGQQGSPTMRYDFDASKRESIYELEDYMPDSVEVRRYIMSETVIRKEGYIDGPTSFKRYTDEDSPFEENELRSPSLTVETSELETLARLVFDPEGAADHLESLPRLPF